MRRVVWGMSAAALLAAVALVALAPPARTADAPLAGKWKVHLQLGPPLWLVKIEDKNHRPKAALLSTGEPDFKDSKIEAFSVDGKKLQITFIVKVEEARTSFPVTVYFPADKKSPKTLLGSTLFRGQRLYSWLEKTDADELDPKKAIVSPAQKDLEKASRMEDEEKREKALRAIEKKYAGDLVAQVAAQQLIGLLVDKDQIKEGEVKALADKAIAFSSAYGPEMQIQTTREVAAQLARSRKTAAVAVFYARQARKALGPKATYEERLPILTVLATALRKSGKEAEAAKVDITLDQEFLKNAVPFKARKYAGRASKSERVVVLELFTGAQCPPCVAADIAFDALLKRYKPTDVVLLQYHLHIPAPDPLTTADSEKRAEYYDVEGTPAVFIDGKSGPSAGGARDDGKDSYDSIHKAIDKQLEEDGAGTLKLTAARKGDKIEMAADIANLKKTGEDVRLRFLLVEDVVRYVGGNGQRFHHHVVRGFPGGAQGFALEKKSSKQTATVSLKDLTKDLTAYLEKQDFEKKDWPLDLKHLKVVALIQDVKTKEILQAAQVDLSEK